MTNFALQPNSEVISFIISKAKSLKVFVLSILHLLETSLLKYMFRHFYLLGCFLFILIYNCFLYNLCNISYY